MVSHCYNVKSWVDSAYCKCPIYYDVAGKTVVPTTILTIFLLPGVTLSEKEPLAQFDVPEIPEEYVVHSHKLIIKQISLGPDAKTGEYNVVQVCKYVYRRTWHMYMRS